MMQVFRAMVCSVLWFQGHEAGVLGSEQARQVRIVVLHVGGDVPIGLVVMVCPDAV